MNWSNESVRFLTVTEKMLGKNDFVTATKLGTTNKIIVAATKNFAAATKRFVDRTKHFVVVTKYFANHILTNDFVSITKPFFPWTIASRKRFVNIASANQNCCSDNLNCYIMNCYHNYRCRCTR